MPRQQRLRKLGSAPLLFSWWSFGEFSDDIAVQQSGPKNQLPQPNSLHLAQAKLAGAGRDQPKTPAPAVKEP